jgi:hypothetical protein
LQRQRGACQGSRTEIRERKHVARRDFWKPADRDTLPVDRGRRSQELPADVSLEEFTAFLKRAVGDKVDVKLGVGGFVANLGEVAIGWVGEKSEGKPGDALVTDAIGLMKIACDDATLKLSPVANQSLDGVRVLRQSFTCSIFGMIDQYSEAIIAEDGARFEAFYNGGLATERAAIIRSGDGIVAALVATYR